ncbi:MAG: toll/interleukin-1 receptor domain-containing protein [Thermoanaerobaculia bacterium]|nr:toll/interleukin-1 receptor domain-containing protein [Thermoanaerobaculia bacterium]
MESIPARVFVSYSHKQGEWVLDRLVPVLKAGGAEVLIDEERFEAGKPVRGQMDAVQDQAEVNVLVLSPEYLASDYCQYEMNRAIARDPDFKNGSVVPVKRAEVSLPAALHRSETLYLNLTDDSVAKPWDLLLGACRADLGTAVPAWLEARAEIRRFLERGESVNLVVHGKPAWRELIDDLCRRSLRDLAVVNLEKPAAARRGLIAEVLAAFGVPAVVPAEPEDLGELDRFLAARGRSLLALTHFDLAAVRAAYGVDLFAALRYLIMESRQLVLLAQSRRPFATLLPAGHPLSEINLQTVELRGRRS